MKLEELLKSKGWSDADIQAAAPMLADERIRTTLEETYGTLERKVTELSARDDEWNRKLNEDYQPRLTAMEREVFEERRKRAVLEEDVRIARDYGLLPQNELDKTPPTPAPGGGAPKPADFDANNYPTWSDIRKLVDAEGQAIAMAADLEHQHRFLTGKSLYDYVTSDAEGRELRGMTALRTEAVGKKQRLDQYIAQKFDYPTKRVELQRREQQEFEARIRADENSKVTREITERFSTNPNFQIPSPSRQPFMPQMAKDQKLPWERGTPDQIKAERVRRNIANELARRSGQQIQ